MRTQLKEDFYPLYFATEALSNQINVSFLLKQHLATRQLLATSCPNGCKVEYLPGTLEYQVESEPELIDVRTPFDGHLSHKAVQDAFVSYGKVLYGVNHCLSSHALLLPQLTRDFKAWYLHTPDGLQTYGFVEFDNEADARNAIRALLTGG